MEPAATCRAISFVLTATNHSSVPHFPINGENKQVYIELLVCMASQESKNSDAAESNTGFKMFNIQVLESGTRSGLGF